MGDGIFGQLNSLILLISYITYLCTGLLMIFMGMWYSGSTGAVGNTGLGLLILGVFFMVLGAVALLGWKKKNGLILLVVESISIALYFVLFFMIVTALMLGSGARDPIKRLFDDHWETTKYEFYGAQPATYVTTCTNGDIGLIPNCQAFDGEMKTKTCLTSGEKGNMNTIGSYALNCTKFDDKSGSAAAYCPTLKNKCVDCQAKCVSMLIAHAKNKNLLVCVVVFLICLYLVGLVILHTLARQGLYTDTEGLCCKSMGPIGWVLCLANSGLMCMGLLMLLVGAATVNTDESNSSSLWIVMLAFGLVVFLLPAVQIAMVALHKVPNYIVDIVYVFLFFALMLVAVFLAFLSGFLVSDINTLYDSKYNEYRGELELFDPSYCSLSEGDCMTVTMDTSTAGAAVYPIKASDRANKPDDATMPRIDREELWKNQHEALQTIRYRNLPPSNFLHYCDSSDLCIRCKPAVTALAKVGFNFDTATINNLTNANSTVAATEADIKANAKAWTSKLFNVTRDNVEAFTLLSQCEVALMKMGGKGRAGVAGWWSKFANPADQCWKKGGGINFEMREGAGADTFTDPYTGETVNVKTAEPKFPEYNRTQKCGEYLVDMMTDNAATGVKGCPDDAQCRAKVRSNFVGVYNYMGSSRVGFCRYPDASCKAKVAYYVSKEFRVLGIGGIFIMIFQLAVIFCTYWGIIEYGVLCLCGGGSDDSSDVDNPAFEGEDEEDGDGGDDE